MGIEAHAEIFSPAQRCVGSYSIGRFIVRGNAKAILSEHNLPNFRSKQIWNWVYQRGVTDFDAMANLPKDLRAILTENYAIDRPTLVTEQKSNDGTIKWLLAMTDGQQVEMVFIPTPKRGTLCVSSQVGCTLTCKFCHTGTQPLVRNLGPHEILQQVMFAKDHLEEWPSSGEKEGRDLTNIVMMGMGEPLYNYQNVAKALKICMHQDGLGISKRHITLSTSGVVPQIVQHVVVGVNLAISLHAPNDEIRSEIMPINNKYPLKDLLNACRNYPGVSPMRRITFEYVMLDGINDADDHARQLTKLLGDIPCKVNLIPFNSWDNSGFTCSPMERIESFAAILEDAELELSDPPSTWP